MSLWSTLPDCGSCLTGLPESAVPVRSKLVFGPPYPGASVVEPATVPPPPLLDPTASERSWALALVRAYRGAVSSRTKKACFVLAKGDITASRYYPMLLSGARKLIEHKLPPAAWAAWSVDVWRSRGEKDAPPLAYVWGAKRIEERRGWFRHEAASYEGGMALYGRAHRTLLAKWNAMAAELMRVVDPADGPKVVERHFPGRSYDALVEAARREAVATNGELQARLESGEWLW